MKKGKADEAAERLIELLKALVDHDDCPLKEHDAAMHVLLHDMLGHGNLRMQTSFINLDGLQPITLVLTCAVLDTDKAKDYARKVHKVAADEMKLLYGPSSEDKRQVM